MYLFESRTTPLSKTCLLKNIFYYSFHIHQNTVNPMPYDSEILIIWYLRRAVPKPEVLDLYKSFLNERGRPQEHVQKNASKSVCTSTAVVFPDPLCLLLQLLQLMKTP
jgi:hypothetical protein